MSSIKFIFSETEEVFKSAKQRLRNSNQKSHFSMFYLASFLFRAVFIFCSACPFVVQANLFADCTFGDVQLASKSAQNMSFSGQIPSSRNRGHSCLVKTNNRDGLLYLRAKRYNQSKGSLHVAVYGTEEAPFQLGHLDISRSPGWNSLPVCPSSLTNEASENYLTFTGTSGLKFSVEIIQEETIKLDEQEEVTINQWSRIKVFQFIPPEDISDKQLDVTVTSESADVPAYLKVSRNCKDVKDNIDVVDYKGESLRLSFAKKGRITLSKFSIPPLTDSTSSWFIGIAINNASGDISFDATKTVKLTLTRSFDYKYSKPLNYLGFGSLGVGIFVSLWAWCSFRGCPCTAVECLSITCWSRCRMCQITCRELCNASWTVLSNYSFGRGHKTYSYITFIVGSVLMVGAFQFVFADWYLMIQEGDRDHCYYNDFCYRVRYYDIPYNLMVSNLAYIIHGLILALNVLCMESDLLARCTKLAANDDFRRHDDKSVQLTGQYQNQSAQIRPDHSQPTQTSPDQIESAQIRPDQIEFSQTEPDYEDLPNHVLVCPDISPHLEKMLVPRYPINKLTEKEAQKIFAGARKKRFTFTIGYALAWALTFEGFFSSLYHLCPRRLTFQFDTSFMFVIASLIVILFYNGIETEECSQVVKVTDRVGAANFFLYFLVPLYYFNYLGTMYHSEAGLTKLLLHIFVVLLIFWCGFMILWASYKLYPETCSKICSIKKCEKEVSCDDCSNACCYPEMCSITKIRSIIKCEKCSIACCVKWVNAIFYILGVWIVPFTFLILLTEGILDFPNLFLVACIVESLVIIIYKVLVKILPFCCQKLCRKGYNDISESSEQSETTSETRCCGCCRRCGCCSVTCAFVCRVTSSVVYVIVTLSTGIVAIVFFRNATTDKVKAPEESRNLNKECYYSDFFDHHDIWHILSSITLLMGALLVLHVSYEPPRIIQNQSTAGNSSSMRSSPNVTEA